jgi:hypothetical protein
MKPLSNSQHFHASEPLLNGQYKTLLDLVRRRTRMRQQRAEKPWKAKATGKSSTDSASGRYNKRAERVLEHSPGSNHNRTC